MQGDLHTHTVVSDGSCTREEVFARARAEGLSALAVTDHDDIGEPDGDCLLGEKYGIFPIYGTELSAYDYRRNRRVHILCYYPQDVGAIRTVCKKTTQNRQEAGLEMARLVAERFPISVEEVLQTAGNAKSIFKQHIMLTLMRAGYATEMYGSLWKELFDVKSGSCVRACVSPEVFEVVKLVRKAGGIAVMAHPFTYNSIDVLHELIGQNLLDGIEVWQSKTTPEQERFLEELADAHGLIKTGGSDFHGSNASKVSPVGKGRTPQESLLRLFSLRDRRKSMG